MNTVALMSTDKCQVCKDKVNNALSDAVLVRGCSILKHCYLHCVEMQTSRILRVIFLISLVMSKGTVNM